MILAATKVITSERAVLIGFLTRHKFFTTDRTRYWLASFVGKSGCPSLTHLFAGSSWLKSCNTSGLNVALGMIRGMLLARHQDKVFEPIIVSDPVDMVNDLVSSDWPAKMKTHYQYMFSYISSFVGVGMIWFQHKYITLRDFPSSLPMWMKFSFWKGVMLVTRNLVLWSTLAPSWILRTFWKRISFIHVVYYNMCTMQSQTQGAAT